MDTQAIELLLQFNDPVTQSRVLGNQGALGIVLFQVVGDFGGIPHPALAIAQHRHGTDPGQPAGPWPVRPGQQVTGLVGQSLMLQLPTALLAVMGYGKLVKDTHDHQTLGFLTDQSSGAPRPASRRQRLAAPAPWQPAGTVAFCRRLE